MSWHPRRPGYSDYLRAARAIHVPEGTSGPWRVSRYTLTPQEADFTRLRALVSGGAMGRGVAKAGQAITMLHRGGTLVMSDTPDELNDAWGFILRAKGRVLVNGVGLGCVLRGLLQKPEVTHIDVVEISEDLLAMMAPLFATAVRQGRMTFHRADALGMRWPVGTTWDCAWHDIWDTIGEQNLPTMGRLHRMYGRRAGWQQSWCHEECKRDRETYSGWG